MRLSCRTQLDKQSYAFSNVRRPIDFDFESDALSNVRRRIDVDFESNGLSNVRGLSDFESSYGSSHGLTSNVAALPFGGMQLKL